MNLIKKKIQKIVFRTKKKQYLSKRQEFVLATMALTLGLLSTQFSSQGLQISHLVVLGISACVLSALVLRQGLTFWKFVTLTTLPTMFTMAVYLFYLLLPMRWLTRLPIALLYSLGMYAILLTENIYNVAADRTIQLLRAAHSVGFLLSLVTMFFLMDTVVSFHMPFYLNGLFVFLITVPLSLQILWSVTLTPIPSKLVITGSFVISLLIAQLAIVLSFWPIKSTIEALFLTTTFYTLVGMVQQLLLERLFGKTIREYLWVLIFVSVIVLFITKWGSGYQ